ncbi:MAG: methyltransferase [Cocleimonas sp.]|nr:methyltransferase [Cocleimonas sp.]
MKLITQSGEFLLERLPKTDKGDLRAWDAADELLLSTVFESHLSNPPEHTPPLLHDVKVGGCALLIINDNFGALSVALHQYTTHSWSDSYLSHLATQQNFNANQLDAKHLSIPSSENLNHTYDLVIIKIPKTLGLLEDQLCRLKPHIHADTIVIAAAMSKHIHTSTLKIFEKFIGTTTTSRATKKARLIFAKNDNPQAHQSPYPKTITDDAPSLEKSLTLINHANVFAKDKLDIGTRVLIEQLKRCPAANHIVDLGCGNGALGIMAGRLQPQAKISFIDESYSAIASAKESYQLDNKEKTGSAHFYNSDCFNQFTEEDVDLILCNPPFHQNHSIGDHIAWEMFKQSHEKLQAGGEMWVVGNRHLAYHVKLKKLFGNCKTIASNKKFVVLVARKNTVED